MRLQAGDGPAPPASIPPAPASRRWIVAWALFVSFVIGSLDRVNLSYAMSAMARDFGWGVEEVGRRGGLLQSLFFLGFGFSNMLLTPLAARFGARRSLLAAVLMFSVFTSLGAPASAHYGLFGATRLLLGIAEGIHFPMMVTLTRRWFPVNERSRANSLWVSGILIATIGAPFLLVPVIEHFGWRSMLMVLGVLGFFITWPVLFWFVHDTPGRSPWIGEAERDWIAARQAVEPVPPGGTGWGFVRQPDFLLTMAAGTMHIFFAYGFLMWLPTYLVEARGLKPDALKWAATMPVLAGLAGVAVTSWIGDRFGGRARSAAAGYMLAGVLAWLATRAGGANAAVLLLSLAGLAQAAFTSQEAAFLQRVLPEESVSRGAGFYNGVAILLGGGGGQWLIGAVIAATHSYGAGIATVTFAGLAASGILMVMHRRLGRDGF